MSEPASLPKDELTTTTSQEDYVNPLEGAPRWTLTAKAYAIRSGASIGFGFSNMISAMAPVKSIWLNSTLSPQWKGNDKIKVDIWELPKPGQDAESTTLKLRPKRPAVINFHGGGFILGEGTDDSLWAQAVVKSLDAVVFSVNYRLAPEYPFPTPVEDCADAILQIARRSEEFGIDIERIILSGFSAGATLSLASWVILQTPQRWEYELAGVAPKIAGFALFYPSLDWTISRPDKRGKSSKPDLTLPKGLTDLFDASYVYPPMPRSARNDPRLSPGLMTDDLLAKLPPTHLCLCEYDMLLAEGERFAERAKAQKRVVSVRMAPEQHGWDKQPSLWGPKKNVHVEYGNAVEAMRRWFSSAQETQQSASL